MMRKVKLIKKILQRVSSSRSYVKIPEFDEYDQDEVNEHVALCVEAGFVEAPEMTYAGQKVYVGIDRMTWKGHEELDRLCKEGCGQ